MTEDERHATFDECFEYNLHWHKMRMPQPSDYAQGRLFAAFEGWVALICTL
jgi:hypothetical protein